jgi:hypothetical protein
MKENKNKIKFIYFLFSMRSGDRFVQESSLDKHFLIYFFSLCLKNETARIKLVLSSFSYLASLFLSKKKRKRSGEMESAG